MISSSPLYLDNFKKVLAFNHADIEKDVLDKEGHYFGLLPEALYTSIEDLHRIHSHELVNGTWVDLGAGVGQSALMYSLRYPDRKSVAVEFSFPRIEAGRKVQRDLDLNNIDFIHDDLMNCEIPLGDTYFLYFPTGPVLDRILFELSQRKDFYIVAIESHGDLLKRLDQETWIERVDTIKLESPRHYPFAVIYRVKVCYVLSEGPFQISFREKFLIIQENTQRWLAESFGLEWLGDKFQLKYPPRTIDWADVKEVKTKEELSEVELNFNALRRLGELKFITKSDSFTASIRKIILYPSFSLDLSIGKQVEFKNIQSIHLGDFLCYDSSSGHFYLPHAL